MTAARRPLKKAPAAAVRYPQPVKTATLAVAAEDAAAHGQAARFQRVFESAYGTEPQRQLWVSFPDKEAAAHASLLFDRGQAAELASHPVQARVIDEWFAASGLERRKDLQIALNLTPSMLSRKGGGDKDLDASVTERMLRHSDLLVRAAEVFGDDGPAWMTKPHPLLDGKTPLEFASNEFGAERVREILSAIEYGGVV
ncbi:antitoxin Xre/MbcA/ParS toxin-binding domain-containing protein [Variovorax ureilyticus]|uniref:Antitoxin Xre/MbcA/ParS toxin-binding domain-containing protein n=1 Tax=Variovorax ureilyticus TaxID=1836198 RepID=A0ABU8VBI5_9BURK